MKDEFYYKNCLESMTAHPKGKCRIDAEETVDCMFCTTQWFHENQCPAQYCASCGMFNQHTALCEYYVAPQKCVECQAYSLHSPLCSYNTPEQTLEHLKTYFAAYQKTEQRINQVAERSSRQVIQANKDREMWKGKFYTLKHENNQLRKNNEKHHATNIELALKNVRLQVNLKKLLESQQQQENDKGI